MFRKARRLCRTFFCKCYNATFNHSLGVVYMLHRIGPNDPDRMSCVEELKVTPERLRSLVNKMRPTHDFIQLDELEKRLSRKRKLGERPFVVFTFDDGYRDNYEYGLPFFVENNIPFSVFVTGNMIGKQQPFNYPFIMERIIKNNDRLVLSDGSIYDCITDKMKNEVFFQLKNRVLDLPYEGFETSFKSLFANYMSDAMSENLMLSWEQIKEMVDSGLCVIGAHTMSHCRLSNVPLESLDYELGECKRLIENNIGCTVDYMSYPFGWGTDINDEVINSARSYYSMAFQSFGGNVRLHDRNRMRVKRVMLYDNE